MTTQAEWYAACDRAAAVNADIAEAARRGHIRTIEIDGRTLECPVGQSGEPSIFATDPSKGVRALPDRHAAPASPAPAAPVPARRWEQYSNLELHRLAQTDASSFRALLTERRKRDGRA